jgi:hypothetical protein
MSAYFRSELSVVYLSCSIVKLDKTETVVASRAVNLDRRGGECEVDADIELTAKDQYRVKLGKTGSTNGNPITPVDAKVTVDYLQ